MDLEQIEAIIAVAECGSFRAAAEQLKRSQPGLSTAIRNLEEEFGVLIFDRSEYRPKLTESGAAFLGVAKTTLEAARYTARVGIELGRYKAETKLQVSVDPLVSLESVELIAQECARPTLPVHLILVPSILRGCHQSLIKGKIDLALAPKPHRCDDLEYILLETVTLVGAVSRRLLQERHKPTEKWLVSNTQILTFDKTYDEPPDELIPHPVLKDHGRKIFVADHPTKLRLIESGLGWGRISKDEMRQNKELVPVDRDIFAHINLDICLLRSKRQPLGPVARSIWNAFEARIGASN